MRSFSTVWIAVSTTVLLLLSCVPSRAGVIPVADPSGITADGQIDWAVLGASDTSVPSPFTLGVPGIPGLQVTVSETEGPFGRADQGNSWWGTFPDGERLLYTGELLGPVSFTFSAPIQGFGVHIENNHWGSFIGSIEAFDNNENSLGSQSFNGNTAIFMGILSNAPDISRVVVSTSGSISEHSIDPEGPNDFAINGPRIQLGAVPEPGSLVLFGTGALGLLVYARRRRS